MRQMTDSANSPVLVGVGAVQQKCPDPRAALEPIELMQRAVQAALADCEAPRIAHDIERIAVPRGMWDYSNPAQLIADRIGAEQCTTELTDFGILQQSLLANACRRIVDGELEVALVAGGEAKYRQLQAQIQGVELQDTRQTDSQPDSFLQPGAELWSEIESAAGLNMPVDFYALIESAICHAAGRSIDSHRDVIAERHSRLSDIASRNPQAWSKVVVPAEMIRNASGKNRMLAFPYTKLHNSQWNVDQASALILCSAAKADALGIPGHKRVYPLASTESNHMVNVSQRARLDESAGARIAGRRALELAGTAMDDIDYLELYSCFPAAIGLFQRALGIADNRDLSVTGGMTFGGGPLNNFVFQATVRMAQLLREQPGTSGLISCVSGMFTKQACGIWSTRQNEAGFAFEDVSQAVKQADTTLQLIAPTAGTVRVVGYTVLFQGSEPHRLVAICEYEDRRRTVACSEDLGLIEQFLSQDSVGRQLLLNDSGQLTAD